MNEALLKFIYSGTEERGYAPVAAAYRGEVDELVENELVELDPEGEQPDGSIHVSVTEEGQKWVQAGQAPPIELKPSVATPARPRGRPRKEPVVVTEQGPIQIIESDFLPNDEAPPAVAFQMPTNLPAFEQPIIHTNTQRLGEPIDGRPFETIDSRSPTFQMPVQPQAFTPYNGPDSVHFDDMAVIPVPSNLHIDVNGYINHGSHSSEPAKPFNRLPEDEQVKLMQHSYGAVNIAYDLAPPQKKTRIKSEERIAPWPFDQMNIGGYFYLTDQETVDFKDVLSAANRVYAKKNPTRVFQMFDAKRVPNAQTNVGTFVFRMG